MIHRLQRFTARIFGHVVAASKPIDAEIIVGSIGFSIGEAYRRWGKSEDQLLDLVGTASDALLDGYGIERPRNAQEN